MLSSLYQRSFKIFMSKLAKNLITTPLNKLIYLTLFRFLYSTFIKISIANPVKQTSVRSSLPLFLEDFPESKLVHFFILIFLSLLNVNTSVQIFLVRKWYVQENLQAVKYPKIMISFTFTAFGFGFFF